MKKIICIMLLIATFIPIQVKAEVATNQTIDINSIEYLSDETNINTTNQKPDTCRTRFYTESLGTTEIKEDYDLVLVIESYLEKRTMEIHLNKAQPNKEIDIPNGKYYVYVKSVQSNYKIDQNKSLVSFTSSVKTYSVKVKGHETTPNIVQIKQEQKKEQKQTNYFLNLLQDNLIVLITLIACVGVLIYRKKVFKR